VNFLKKLAPFLSTGLSLAGPYGALASKILSPILGIKPDAKEDDYTAALAKATPEQIEAIKQAEQQFQLQMKQLEIQSVEELEKLASDDRASARNREIQVTASTGKKDLTPRILAFAVVILCFAGEGLYFFLGAPRNASPELIGRILGTLDSALILVLSYYFGSSAGSDRKTELLASKAPQ
jgi:hypothetical protein